jgi:hypothetical protein
MSKRFRNTDSSTNSIGNKNDYPSKRIKFSNSPIGSEHGSGSAVDVDDDDDLQTYLDKLRDTHNSNKDNKKDKKSDNYVSENESISGRSNKSGDDEVNIEAADDEYENEDEDEDEDEDISNDEVDEDNERDQDSGSEGSNSGMNNDDEEEQEEENEEIPPSAFSRINDTMNKHKPVTSQVDGVTVETFYDLDPDANPADVLDRVNEMRSIRVGFVHPDDIEEEKMIQELRDKAIAEGLTKPRECPVCYVSETTDKHRGIMAGIWSIIDDLTLRVDDRILCGAAVDQYNTRIYEAARKFGDQKARKFEDDEKIPKWTDYEMYKHLHYCDKLVPLRRVARNQEFLLKIIEHLRRNTFEKVTVGNVTMDQPEINTKNVSLLSKLSKDYYEGQKFLISLMTVPKANTIMREGGTKISGTKGGATKNDTSGGTSYVPKIKPPKNSSAYIGQKMPALK